MNWDKIIIILTREIEYHRLENIDLEVLVQLRSFLKPFKQWSDYTETSLRPSLFNVWIAIDSVIQHCAVQDGDAHLVTLMKVKALCYIEKRFVLHKLHRMATFLTPNFKSLRFASRELYELTVKEAKEFLNTIPLTANLERRAIH